MIFFLNLLKFLYKRLKRVLLENNLFQLDIYFLEANGTSNFSVYSCQGNTKLCAKYMNAISEVISFIGDVYLTCLRT